MRRPAPFAADPRVEPDPYDPDYYIGDPGGADRPPLSEEEKAREAEENGWGPPEVVPMIPQEQGWNIDQILRKDRMQAPFDRPGTLMREEQHIDPRGVDAGRMPAYHPDTQLPRIDLEHGIQPDYSGPLDRYGLPHGIKRLEDLPEQFWRYWNWHQGEKT